MLAIIAYAVGIMYSPGPVNLMGLNTGVNGQAKTSLGFCLGVGTAMLLLFLLFGWAGAAWIDGRLLIAVSVFGCGYIIYLAIHIARARIDVNAVSSSPLTLRYRDGLILQLLNPKGIVATLPIATLQFPAAGIQGPGLVIWSMGLALLAAGAPGSYMWIGSLVGNRIDNPAFFKRFNQIMAVLLMGVALSITYEHVWVTLVSA
ncbi:LysE family translocator [Halomonas sp.]|uniref:LysE family translocator n=1 Tax=unclassified Halomonas TaxID=2609666 RepID=UPI003F8E759E